MGRCTVWIGSYICYNSGNFKFRMFQLFNCNSWFNSETCAIRIRHHYDKMTLTRVLSWNISPGLPGTGLVTSNKMAQFSSVLWQLWHPVKHQKTEKTHPQLFQWGYFEKPHAEWTDLESRLPATPGTIEAPHNIISSKFNVL